MMIVSCQQLSIIEEQFTTLPAHQTKVESIDFKRAGIGRWVTRSIKESGGSKLANLLGVVTKQFIEEVTGSSPFLHQEITGNASYKGGGWGRHGSI
uniref:Uncharacterized protein n=1 Tax=Salix viminalis TaxID=40686 RepID=A0A6N2LU48_SALVM